MKKRILIIFFTASMLIISAGIIIWVNSGEYLYKKQIHYNLGLQLFNSGYYEKAAVELSTALNNHAHDSEILDDSIQIMLKQIDEIILNGYSIGRILGDNWLGDTYKIVFNQNLTTTNDQQQLLRLKINVMDPGGFLPCNITVFYKNKIYAEFLISSTGEQNLDIPLPHDISPGDTFNVFSDTFIPKNLGINDDERKLSVMLLDSQIVSMEFTDLINQKFEVSGITPDGWINERLVMTVKETIQEDLPIKIQVGAPDLPEFYPCNYEITYPNGNFEKLSIASTGETEINIYLYKELAVGDKVIIQFDSFNPKKLGINNDSRNLSVQFKKFIVEK